MQVKAKRTHFQGGSLREEGKVFEHTGPLHKHIEPVKQKGQQASKPIGSAPKGAASPTDTAPAPEETTDNGADD